MRLLREFWNDELGAILSAEMVSVGTVAVLGTTVGLGQLRDSLNEEMVDMAKAVRSLDQSYYIPGRAGGGAWTAGSSYRQRPVAESLADLGLSPHTPEGAAPAAPARPMKSATPNTKTYEGTPIEVAPPVFPAAPTEPVTVTPADKKLNPSGTKKN